MNLESRIRKLERKMSKEEMVNLVINYHRDPSEQEKIRKQALSEAGITNCKDVIFIIHYGNKPARTWKEECSMANVKEYQSLL